MGREPLLHPGHEHGDCFGQRLFHAIGAHRCPARDRQLSGLGKVEGVRAQHHRATAGRSLDQIVATERRKTAAQQRHVRAAVVQRHLAHRVSEPDLSAQGLWRRCVAPGAAARQAQAHSTHQRRHFVKAMRVARHDQQQRSRLRHLHPGREQHRFFTFAGDCGEHDVALQQRTPGLALPQLGGVGRDVELQVATHDHWLGAAGPQAARVPFGLSQHQRQALYRRVHQRRQPLTLLLALVAQPRIGQHHRQRCCLGRMQQVRPDLGFHQHPNGRPEPRQKAPHGARCVVGQPGLRVAVAQQAATRFHAGGGAMCQQQAHAGAALPQRVDQGRGSARLTQRYRVNPDGAGRRWQRR